MSSYTDRYAQKIALYCAERNIDQSHAEHFSYLLNEAMRNHLTNLFMVRVGHVAYHAETSRDSVDFAQLAQSFTVVNWSDMVPHVVAPDIETAAIHLAFCLRERMCGFPGWRVGGGERFTFQVTCSTLDQWGESYRFWPRSATLLESQWFEVKNGELSTRKGQ